MSTPRTDLAKNRISASVLSGRLTQCHEVRFNWKLLPPTLEMECRQAGKAISMPPIAVLAGLLVTIGFAMSHSVVQVADTDWVEPVLLWIAICMQTGSGKSGLCRFLKSLVSRARGECKLGPSDPAWCLDDQSFEKMGAIMSENHGKLLGLYDELPMFLSQINVFSSRGVTNSHEVAMFLQLYGASEWVRRTVSGEANFSIERTGMTLGGFIQPGISRTIVEQPANVEKGLCQRFLWLISQPCFDPFDQLQHVNEEFISSIAHLMSCIWVKDKSVRVWTLPRTPAGDKDKGDENIQLMGCGHFEKKFNKLQGMLKQIGVMDEFLSGILSKSKGQILRVAAVMHVLFNKDTPDNIPQQISEEAVIAADCFVDLCLQHSAFLAGKGNIQKAVEEITQVSQHMENSPVSEDKQVASFCLTIPGKMLHISTLLAKKFFRNRGNKDGAVRAIKMLEKGGLGTVYEDKPVSGTTVTYRFKKASIPKDEGEQLEFLSKLLTFGVTLEDYKDSLAKNNITPALGERIRNPKRPHSQTPSPSRKSSRPTDSPYKTQDSTTPSRP